MRLDDARLTSLQYDYAILDEAQYAKNVESQTAKVVRRLKAKNRLCLTGTPIENNLTELYSQMQFLNPGIFGTLDQFKHNLAIPIEKHSDKAKSQHLQELIKPFILRRTKEQVLLDLPSKTEQLVTIEMGDAQRQFYESIKNYYQAKILKLVDEQGVSRSHLQILEALLRLRQVCCDPRLIKSNSRAGSVKLTETIRLITEALAEGHKILLFSQFTSMIELIKEELIKSGLAHLILTGSTPSRQRAQLIKDFQDSSTPLVFLLSLKAGGIGVNLTGADYVIHYDPWWNPSVENQATDRAHRIGQTKAVTVYKLIIKNSIEEKILTLQAKKRDLIDRVILGGKVSKELTREDLEYLLG
jgi:non-specific serine/threonine protein kinase